MRISTVARQLSLRSHRAFAAPTLSSPPLSRHGLFEPPRIVCRVRTTTDRSSGGGDGDGGGGGSNDDDDDEEDGGGNRPEPDAHLQVQEALTRGSSVRELAYLAGFLKS